MKTRMVRSLKQAMIVGSIAICISGSTLQAQETKPATTQPASTPPASTQPAEPPPEPSKPLPGPKYTVMRYDEDFSYLDGPEGSYQKDFFDPIKNIHLGDDWRLSLGGEVRTRLESRNNMGFGALDPSQDTFLLWRVMVHADLRYRNLARIFVQGIHTEIEDNDGPFLPIYENRYDFQQAFLDLRFLGEDIPLTVRVGRQELLYGKQRLVSPLDWASTQRRFDGVKLFWRSEKLDVDAWWTFPVPVSIRKGYNRRPDHYRHETMFYGLYSTYRFNSTHGVDGYFLAIDDTGNLTNANGRAGDLTLFTLGTRLWGRTGPWDYEGEFAGQWGRWAGDTIQAWMVTTEGGYTFKSLPWTPRIGVGFDYASGDDDPTDGSHQTFNQMFPLGHAYLGWMDLVGRQNIYDARIHLTVKPLKNLTALAVMHNFWLAEERDALYNAGGVPRRRSLSGTGGSQVGQELDLLIKWKIDVHSSMLFGYSHFWDSNFISATGPSDDPNFFYVQYGFKF